MLPFESRACSPAHHRRATSSWNADKLGKRVPAIDGAVHLPIEDRSTLFDKSSGVMFANAKQTQTHAHACGEARGQHSFTPLESTGHPVQQPRRKWTTADSSLVYMFSRFENGFGNVWIVRQGARVYRSPCGDIGHVEKASLQ